ncbi:hypothetical protein [Scytonema sp. NUACC26]|uniref:hypothetical protein n=1 Tax=Scytonema sp. NUACC26 TaxID=3140176 RepID=UPI0034DBD6B2
MTKMICVDASFIVRFLSDINPNSSYQQKWHQLQTEGCILVAPTLVFYETCNAFHRAAIAGQITQEANCLIFAFS